MTDLASRYGAPSRSRRRALIALVVVLAVGGLSWLAWAAIYQSTPKVRSELVGFQIQDDHTARGVLSVSRADTDVVASCFVRAVAEDHTVVGEKSVVVRDGPTDQEVTVEIRTERRATTVEGQGCTAAGQPQRK